MTNLTMQRPNAGEYAPHFAKYVDLVPGEDLVGALGGQIGETLATLRVVSDGDSLKRYADGKWSLREVVGHMIDTERIFAYRALRIARGDETPLPGFDQDPYIAAARFDERKWGRLLEEFEAVRRSNLFLFEGLDAEAWGRRGVSSGSSISVRGLGFVIAGHELHHMRIVRERYLA
jgi:DinB superfamily